MGIKKIKFGLASFAAGMVLALSSLAALPGISYATADSISWTGQGADSVNACDTGQTPYLHWIFTTGGNSSVDSAALTSNQGNGAMSQHGGSWTVDTAYSGTGQPTTSTVTASVTYTGSLGSGTANLVISDGCYGTGGSGGVTDVCANLDGAQATVPEGYHADGSNCYQDEQETDMCPNIEGNQANVPEGMHLDDQGNCVENQNNEDHTKVTICHATGSQTNPYVEITPDASGVVNGHYDHQDGRDIIPAFDFNGQHYAGQNLGNGGQAILDNHCVVGGQGGGQQDCDGDFDNSPASECTNSTTTTGQVLGASVVGGSGAAQVSVVPQGSVNGGGGAASRTTSGASAIGLVGSLLSLGTGLAFLNRRQS